MTRIGAQLYTVRKLLTTNENIQTTLTAIKALGYDTVQLYGSVEQMEACAQGAEAAGLAICGALVSMTVCEEQASQLFRICKQYRIPDIGISSSPKECTQTESYIRRVNAFAAKARQEGFTFSYHNHGHEFIKPEGKETVMDRFLQGFDANAVDFMPDTYWIHDGGCDVRHFLEQTKYRVRLLHLKDLKRTPQGHTFAELGNGNLWFKGILDTALACGIREFIVEQDICDGDPLDSLRQSYTYLKTLLEG